MRIVRTTGDGPRLRDNPGLRLAALAVILLALGLGGWYLFIRGDRPLPPRTDVATFTGEGNQTTASFTVREPWQIHWENEGESFSFAVRGDLDLGTLIEQEGPGSGVTSPVGSGTFHLEVTADGPWRVQIFQND